MSASPMISKSIANNQDDPYSTLYVENLLGGLNEWRNIQDIVRSTFKAMCEVVRSQGIAIKELEKQVASKASKAEVNSGLNIKANVADIMRTFSEVAANIDHRPTMEEIQAMMDDKISKADLQYYLNSKPSMDEVRHIVDSKFSNSEIHTELSTVTLRLDELQKDFSKKSSQFANAKDLSHLQSQLEQKANLTDVNDALATKANKDNVITALHKKANKSDIDAVLKTKVDTDELQAIILTLEKKADVTDFEKLQSCVENKAERSDIISLSNSLNTKAEMKDFDMLNVCYQELKRDTFRKIDDIDQDLDRLIENIKKQFQNLNIVINNLEVNKMDFKDFEKINTSLSKKIDNDTLQNALGQFKIDIYDSFSHFKNESLQNIKSYEDQINERLAIIEKNTDKSFDDFARHKEKISEYFENRKLDHEEVLKQAKVMLTSYSKDLANETNALRIDVQKLSLDLAETFNKKVDKKEFDIMRNKLFKDLEQKSDIADFENFYKNIQKELDEKDQDNHKNIAQFLKSFENDFQRALEKKANIYDVTMLLNNKADLASINLAMQSKLNTADYEALKLGLEKISREVTNKVDFNKFEAYVNDSRAGFEDVQKDLIMKANIKEMLGLLKNKADIDDVNKALTQIHEELDVKCNNEQFNSAMENQSIINDALCAENCVARWTWKSGQVKNGYAIPWEIQTVNTAPDNFLWDKDKTAVMVVAAGLYEITMGFYADKKPTIQILVNGEPVMSAVNSASYVVHHSSGKLKNMGRHSNGNITGLTLIDFICLPERSRISVSFSGEEGAEGFLGLRKI